MSYVILNFGYFLKYIFHLFTNDMNVKNNISPQEKKITYRNKMNFDIHHRLTTFIFFLMCSYTSYLRK